MKANGLVIGGMGILFFRFYLVTISPIVSFFKENYDNILIKGRLPMRNNFTLLSRKAPAFRLGIKDY
jgi:hypothetical protein